MQLLWCDKLFVGQYTLQLRQLDKTPHWSWNRSLGPWTRNMQTHTCWPTLQLAFLLFFSFPTKKIKCQMNLMLRKACRVRFPQALNSVSDSLGGLTIDSLSGVAEAKLFVIWSWNPDAVAVAGHWMQRKWLTTQWISSQQLSVVWSWLSFKDWYILEKHLCPNRILMDTAVRLQYLWHLKSEMFPWVEGGIMWSKRGMRGFIFGDPFWHEKLFRLLNVKNLSFQERVSPDAVTRMFVLPLVTFMVFASGGYQCILCALKA